MRGLRTDVSGDVRLTGPHPAFNNMLSSEYKCISMKILSSTTVFNVNNDKKQQISILE